jgi:ubiquinone/menaquinone biosynthesis C-methylase UbiE
LDLIVQNYHTGSVTLNAYICDLLSQWFFDSINKPLTILDFGCGDGLLTHFIQQAFFNALITGIDSDQKQIFQNQQEYPSLPFVVNKNSFLPFNDTTFDLIYAVNVFHHIPINNHKRILDELLRILKPHGSLIVFETNPYNLQAREFFKKEHVRNVHMINTRYWKKLLQNFQGNLKILYLYPNFLKLQNYLNKIPFGSLYALSINKKVKNIY